MDRAEAIEILRKRRTCALYDSDAEALDLAIEALGDAESATTTDCNYTCSDCKHQDKTYEQEPCHSCFNNDGAGYEPDTDCISRQDAIEEIALHDCTNGEVPYFTGKGVQEILNTLPPVTPTEQNEEDILKFYYVESLDEYWIGQRCGTRYYGKWTGNCFTYGYSRYLPWGEHVVAPDTLWKEHTYPSEPKEIPFNEWLQGFLEKECQTERTGEWKIWNEPGNELVYCTKCKHAYDQIDLYIGGSEYPNFCPNCGAKMKGEK